MEEKRKERKQGKERGEGEAEWGRQREVKKRKGGEGKEKIAFHHNYASYARILNMSTQKKDFYMKHIFEYHGKLSSNLPDGTCIY